MAAALRTRRHVGRYDVSILYMSWSRDGPGDRDAPRGYHHGNLREALIGAALELIARKGIEGFTFAEAARFAGVSPGAPYRHFRDRDELMASVALRGFEHLEAALARAWNGGRPNAFSALDWLGKAYLDFARTQPAFYLAMFEGGVPVGANASVREASERAFAVLRGAADEICAAMPAAALRAGKPSSVKSWTIKPGVDGDDDPAPMVAAVRSGDP